MSPSRAPVWLRPMWEQKAAETVERVSCAVKRLKTDGAPITLAAICKTVLSLYHASMSANTILRNPAAYDLYSTARGREIGPCTKDQALRIVVNAVCGAEREKVQAKIQRLRRRSKDSLIAAIIRLERDRAQQADIENALRDELLKAALVPRSSATMIPNSSDGVRR